MANIQDGPLADFQRDARKPPDPPRKATKSKAPRPKRTSPPKPPKAPKPRRAPRKHGRRRLKKAVLACVVAAGVLGVLCGAAYLTARKWAAEFVEQYTQAQPWDVPQAALAGKQLAAVEKRVAAFAEAVRAGTQTEPLALSEDEVNALVQGNEAWHPFEGRAHLSFEGHDVTAKLSIPLESAGWENLKGRYLNGTAAVLVSFEHGRLSVIADDFSARAKKLPQEWQGVVRTRNLAEDANRDSGFARMLEGIEGIEVKASALFITPKTAAAHRNEYGAENEKAGPAHEPVGEAADQPNREDPEPA